MNCNTVTGTEAFGVTDVKKILGKLIHLLKAKKRTTGQGLKLTLFYFYSLVLEFVLSYSISI